MDHSQKGFFLQIKNAKAVKFWYFPNHLSTSWMIANSDDEKPGLVLRRNAQNPVAIVRPAFHSDVGLVRKELFFSAQQFPARLTPPPFPEGPAEILVDC